MATQSGILFVRVGVDEKGELWLVKEESDRYTKYRPLVDVIEGDEFVIEESFEKIDG